ncbi:hypothetical protein [Treponema sp.]|uniref:hypothetical protein n=1 Tax=Treponema sp. TaxID=166 RepID=UPI0025D5A6EF|nr:hypothetical protein [Treponema sp.]MCR5218096.1 hypothetical protein [Treponema sp.]
MKIRKNILVAAAAVLIYIITITAFVSSLYIENQKGRSKSPEYFSSLIHQLSVTLRNEEPGTRAFNRYFLNSSTINNFQSIKLFYEGKEILNFPSDNEKTKQKSFTILKRDSLRTSQDKDIFIEASVYTVKPSVIFTRGRLAFIVIFIVTLFIVFHLMFFADKVLTSEAKEIKYDSDEEDDFSQEDYQEDQDYTEEDDDLEISAKEKDDADLKNEPESPSENLPEEIIEDPFNENKLISNNEEEVDFTPPEIKEETREEENPFEEKTPADRISEEEKEEKEEDAEEDLFEEELIDTEESPASDEEDKKELPQEPAGLFSPDTGFGWESYMIPRLDSELIRAASCEQDLALYTIRIPSLDWTSECGKKISGIILQAVKFNDLVFNYKEDGCSAIIQELNIPQALNKAQEMLKNINSVIKNQDKDLRCSIGISTRALRLISGQRLFNESEQSLFHAIEDEDSPIVAFKADSEKYRNYLASKKD